MAVRQFVSRLGIVALLEQLRTERPQRVAEDIARGCGFDIFRAAIVVDEMRETARRHATTEADLRAPISRVAQALGVE